ncbi:MAG: hypothetical protein LBK43_07785 [Treponema sp.]|nr:hypothetical protein [Treponema sp.]
MKSSWGSPAFTPVILCLCSMVIAPLCGGDFSLSAAGGSLLVMPGGMSGYGLGGFAYTGETGLFLNADAGEVFLNLPEVHGDITTAAGRFGLHTQNFGAAFTVGGFSHAAFTADFGQAAFNSEGGSGVLFDTALSFRIRGLTLEPSASYATGSWGKGDFYWFFGKPNLPAWRRLGLTGALGAHGLGFSLFSLDADILDNDGVGLFKGASRGAVLYYRFSGKSQHFPVNGVLGYCYAAAEMDGELTASNQGYSLFPYRFYNLDASFSAHAGFALVNLEYRFFIFRINAALGAIHVFQGTGSVDIHYREKSLFGGNEKTDSLGKDVGGLGAAFLSADFGIPSLRLGAKTSLALGIKKTLALPWGYRNILSADESGPSDTHSGGGPDTDLIRTILLSGLSLYASLAIH